jgi:hypothetical protein
MMAPDQEIVTCAARLVGMGRNVGCSLSLCKNPDGSAYIKPMVHDEPTDLPDGTYIMAFGEYTIELQKIGGWIVPNLTLEPVS